MQENEEEVNSLPCPTGNRRRMRYLPSPFPLRKGRRMLLPALPFRTEEEDIPFLPFPSLPPEGR
eukprot:3720949-Pyramimonas_sp.AAC.1